MESVIEVILLKSGELTSRRGIPSGELIFGNVLDAALARRLSFRVSSGTSDGESHMS